MVIANLKKLLLRVFPEPGGQHVTRIGQLVAIADPPQDEKTIHRFRPRYAADVWKLHTSGTGGNAFLKADPDAATGAPGPEFVGLLTVFLFWANYDCENYIEYHKPNNDNHTENREYLYAIVVVIQPE